MKKEQTFLVNNKIKQKILIFEQKTKTIIK